jgi:hypothetical protein
MGKIIPGTDYKSWNRTGNRSNPHPGAPQAPDMRVQGAGVGKAKPMQKELGLHPSTTLAQTQGRAHPVPGVGPMAPVSAYLNGGKDTPTPAVTYGADGRDGGARHGIEIGDAILDEAVFCGSARLPGERHHSVTGPKVKGSLT